MSVLVCIPTDRDIDSRTAENAFAICSNFAGGASFRTVRAHPTDRCRNLCVEGLLRSQHSHILFIDSDIVPPVGCLEAMLAVKRPIVSGICPVQLEGELCTAGKCKTTGQQVLIHAEMYDEKSVKGSRELRVTSFFRARKKSQRRERQAGSKTCVEWEVGSNVDPLHRT